MRSLCVLSCSSARVGRFRVAGELFFSSQGCEAQQRSGIERHFAEPETDGTGAQCSKPEEGCGVRGKPGDPHAQGTGEVQGQTCWANGCLAVSSPQGWGGPRRNGVQLETETDAHNGLCHEKNCTLCTPQRSCTTPRTHMIKLFSRVTLSHLTSYHRVHVVSCGTWSRCARFSNCFSTLCIFLRVTMFQVLHSSCWTFCQHV